MGSGVEMVWKTFCFLSNRIVWKTFPTGPARSLGAPKARTIFMKWMNNFRRKMVKKYVKNPEFPVQEQLVFKWLFVWLERLVENFIFLCVKFVISFQICRERKFAEVKVFSNFWSLFSQKGSGLSAPSVLGQSKKLMCELESDVRDPPSTFFPKFSKKKRQRKEGRKRKGPSTSSFFG